MVEALFTKPVHWLLGIVVTLIAVIWKDQKQLSKANNKAIGDLEKSLKGDYYKKEEVQERIDIGLHPLHLSMEAMAEALNKNTEILTKNEKALSNLHTDFKVFKAVAKERQDPGDSE